MERGALLTSPLHLGEGLGVRRVNWAKYAQQRFVRNVTEFFMSESD